MHHFKLTKGSKVEFRHVGIHIVARMFEWYREGWKVEVAK